MYTKQQNKFLSFHISCNCTPVLSNPATNTENSAQSRSEHIFMELTLLVYNINSQYFCIKSGLNYLRYNRYNRNETEGHIFFCNLNFHRNGIYYTIIDWWWGQHMICWTWRQNVARGRRPRATFCLKVQHIICCPNPQSIIVLLYLHWIRITYSIKTIHKQTDHDQTGLNLDELIWDEWKTFTPVRFRPLDTCVIGG